MVEVTRKLVRIRTAQDLAADGQVDAARKIVESQPPGVIVIEVNQTTPDPDKWRRGRR